MNDLTYIASLVVKVKKGDRLAMRSLYECYCKSMMATSLRITNSLPDSEDILQEAFMSSFQKIHSLHSPKRYGGWLKQIVVNGSLKFVQKRREFIEIGENEVIEQEVELCGQKPDIVEIKHLIQQLPDGAREVFSLHLLEGYKHREIAQMLDIALSTSKSQYRYALKLLTQKLKTKGYDGAREIYN